MGEGGGGISLEKRRKRHPVTVGVNQRVVRVGYLKGIYEVLIAVQAFGDVHLEMIQKYMLQ